MSLLMDALKRAEEAKRQQQGASGAESAAPDAKAELSLEPVGSAAGLPDLDSHQASVDADLKATAAENDARGATRSAAYAASASAIAQQRSAAQAVFAAKEEAAPSSPVKRLIVIGSIGAVLAAGVGGYYYWQIQAISGAGSRLAARPGTPMPTRPVAPPALPQIPTAAPAPDVLAAAPASSAAGGSAPVPAAKVPDTASVAPTAAAPKPTKASDGARTRVASENGAVRKRAAAPSEASVQAPEAPLRISTQGQESLVQRAWDELQAGRVDAARSTYQQALRSDPRNADALVGLATIAQRSGDAAGAERLFQQALEADPRHAAAHAGLVALRGDADLPGAESRLKTLISQQGGDPAANGALYFALGNVYAGQRRWNDAQQAFFRAHAADAEHPDYQYNLAVSLDHLGQSKAAAQYYDKAIRALQKRPGAFDKAQGERRLAELQQ